MTRENNSAQNAILSLRMLQLRVVVEADAIDRHSIGMQSKDGQRPISLFLKTGEAKEVCLELLEYIHRDSTLQEYLDFCSRMPKAEARGDDGCDLNAAKNASDDDDEIDIIIW